MWNIYVNLLEIKRDRKERWWITEKKARIIKEINEKILVPTGSGQECMETRGRWERPKASSGWRYTSWAKLLLSMLTKMVFELKLLIAKFELIISKNLYEKESHIVAIRSFISKMRRLLSKSIFSTASSGRSVNNLD